MGAEVATMGTNQREGTCASVRLDTGIPACVFPIPVEHSLCTNQTQTKHHEQTVTVVPLRSLS